MSRESIKQAIELAGTQQELVEKMRPHLPEHLRGSFRQGHISNWLHRPRRSPVPPAEYLHALVMATDGRMQLHDFRPDLYPAAKKEKAA